jgi:hypothetical protein
MGKLMKKIHCQPRAPTSAPPRKISAHAEASLLERQLAQAEQAVAQARTAVIRARDDKAQVKAAQAILTASAAERDRLVAKLSAANTTTAQAEGNAIASTSEFAAIQFIAGATGASTDTVARAAILTISAMPDMLAVLLLLAAGYSNSEPAPVTPATVEAKPIAERQSRRSRASRKGWVTRKRRAMVAAHQQPMVLVEQ